MTLDHPDWMGAFAPIMPVAGEGQVPWFQSDFKEVGGVGEADLINYVVPDDMELHVCSGIVSCAFPRLQRYKLVTIPAATWVSPTSHSDPANEWWNEERVYDGDILTHGSGSGPPGVFGSYLTLLVNLASIDKIRFYADYSATYQSQIDVDVWIAGAWVPVYTGAYADREWVEKDIPLPVRLVSKARVRFYCPYPFGHSSVFHEFQFNTSGETTQEGIYFDTHAIIPYLPQAPYLVPAGATFVFRVYNDDDAAHNMSVSLAGFLQKKV